MKQRKFDALLRRAVGVPILALSVFALLLLWEIESLSASLRRLNRADQAISADRELINSTIDTESGVHEYLNTGKEEFLQTYTKAAAGIESKFAELNKLVSNQPVQQVQLAAMQSSFDNWLLLAQRAVESHRTGKENGVYQTSAAADSLRLTELMDSIRAQHEAFTLAEVRVRAVFAQRALGVSRLTAITCGLLVVVGGGLMALFIRRQMQLLGKDFEASLEAAEKHAASLLEKAQLLDLAYDTILVRTLEGTIRFWNHGAEETYGYSSEQATGQNSQALLHTTIAEPMSDIKEKLLRDGRWEGELTRTIKDGTHVIVASRWVTQRDKGGRPCGVMEISSDITMRKRREEQLRERELLLRMVAELTDIGLAVLSAEGRYLYSNPAYCEMFGISPENSLGKHVADVMGNTYKQICSQLETAKAGEQVDFEIEIAKRQGAAEQAGPRSYAITFKPLLGAGGATRVIAVFIDITERKRAEEDLRISQERLSAIVRMAMDGVMTLDESQNIILFNPAAEKIFGCSAASAIGKPIDHFIPSHLADHQYGDGQVRWHAGEGGDSSSPQEIFGALGINFGVRADGRKFPLEATISQVNLTHERLYTVILRDVTQRKQVEEDLREKEERFRSMYEHAAVGIAQVSIEGAYIMVNPALCTMLGYSEAELLNMAPRDVTHPGDLAEDSVQLQSMFLGERPFFETEKRYIHRTGTTVWVSLTSSLVRDTSKRPLYRISVVQDVTRRKRAEDQLQQAQKMEAIGRLAGGVAHDFNNLLTVILGNAELVLDGLPESDPDHIRIEEIQSAGETAADLTKKLLAFSRKEVIAKRVVDLKQVVLGMRSMLRRLLSEDVEMVVTCAPEGCPVEAQPSELEQVVLNLAVNAGDSMRRGGRLTIDVRSVASAAVAHENMSTHPGPLAMLTVSDTGSGIDPETVPHIFEPFFTTKPVGEGTGLGLATVYGIVTQCGGSVMVSSRVGEGSSFKVCLPRFSGHETGKESVESAPENHDGSETILLVDDSAPLRKMLSVALSRSGYCVLEASDGVQACEISKSHPGPIDLLITDIVMPRMGGTELAKTIVQDRADIALVFTTGYAADNYAIPNEPLRRIATIQKPYRIDELLRVVRNILDKE